MKEFDKIHFYEYYRTRPYNPEEINFGCLDEANLVIIADAQQAALFNERTYLAEANLPPLPHKVGIYKFGFNNYTDKGYWQDVSEQFGVVAFLVNKFTREVC